MGLYKGKYLIAVYNKEDYCVYSTYSVAEMSEDLGIAENTIFQSLNRNLKGLSNRLMGYDVYLIDCTEKHDDIFAEEDAKFLAEEKKYFSRDLIDQEIAKRYNVSARTIKRWKSNGKIDIQKELELEGER